MPCPPIHFYIPPGHWPHPFPGPPKDGWPGYKKGIYAWTLQTYYILREHHVECQLTDHVEGVGGVILAHQDLIDWDYKPRPGQLLVAMQADWGRHPYAQVHICQNRAQVDGPGLSWFYRVFWPGRRYFVRHWTQAGLVPRSPHRPDTLDTLAFFGRDINLAPELKAAEWSHFLAEQGICWKVVNEWGDWTDYSGIDAVVTCRDFTGELHHKKPATKLFNCCLAGCVPICTPESAVLDELHGEEDLILVRSYAELKQQIVNLKHDRAYYARMRQRAIEMGERYGEERLVAEWVAVLEDLAANEWPRWRKAGLRFRAFLIVRTLARRLKRWIDRLR